MQDNRAILERFVQKHKPRPFEIEKFLFKEQLDFVKDPAKYADAVCSVRAGKTTACAADLIDTAEKLNGVTCIYITLARSSAETIVWPELRKINSEYTLNAEINLSKLTMHFKNGSWIRLYGGNDETEIEKIRGLSNVALVYIDEAQAFRQHIKTLVEDIVAKRLYDTNGRCRLIGTPGPVEAGYFYECSQSSAWSHHHWTMLQNPWLEKKSGLSPQMLIDQDCARKGVTHTDPSIQRECYGNWCYDPDALVFKYDAKINHFDKPPAINETVMGIDVGFNDSDSISVVGWANESPAAYLLEECIKAKQGITALVTDIERLIKVYSPLRIVMDTGGLGKKIAEEISGRYSIPVEAAEKTRKLEFIELLNDAMRTKRFFAKKDSRFAQDCMLVKWDQDKSQDKEKKVVSDSFHSDATDSALYAWREALSWLHEPEVLKPKFGTEAWVKQQAIDMEQSLVDQFQQSKKEDDGW